MHIDCAGLLVASVSGYHAIGFMVPYHATRYNNLINTDGITDDKLFISESRPGFFQGRPIGRT